jgi:hypothetical protein
LAPPSLFGAYAIAKPRLIPNFVGEGFAGSGR